MQGKNAMSSMCLNGFVREILKGMQIAAKSCHGIHYHASDYPHTTLTRNKLVTENFSRNEN